jgi:hypothetical protein
LLTYLALPGTDKQAVSQAMWQRARDLFDVHDKILLINQVVDEAIAHWTQARTAMAGNKKITE